MTSELGSPRMRAGIVGFVDRVFRTPDFGLRTRRWMSGYGYERTSSASLLNVRF